MASLPGLPHCTRSSHYLVYGIYIVLVHRIVEHQTDSYQAKNQASSHNNSLCAFVSLSNRLRRSSRFLTTSGGSAKNFAHRCCACASVILRPDNITSCTPLFLTRTSSWSIAKGSVSITRLYATKWAYQIDDIRDDSEGIYTLKIRTNGCHDVKQLRIQRLVRIVMLIGLSSTTVEFSEFVLIVFQVLLVESKSMGFKRQEPFHSLGGFVPAFLCILLNYVPVPQSSAECIYNSVVSE